MTSVQRRAAGGGGPVHVTSRETKMLLIHEALARSHQMERRREAEQVRRAVRVVAQRRWQRRAEKAASRARALSAAIH